MVLFRDVSVNQVRQSTRLQNHSLLHRVLGLIFLRLNDRTSGKQELRTAFSGDPVDVAAGLVLSLELRKDQDLHEGFLIAKQLIDSGWSDPDRSNPYNAGFLIQNYYLPLIWQGETERVIDDTHDWRTKGAVRGTLGTMRAKAFRQSLDAERNSDVIQNTLCQAIEVLDEVFDLMGMLAYKLPKG